ncbi:hypothetical protein D623_10020249 [Myotis brandtii]|uniref:Uncharacterized protein n=1 Tax=Myotis brandtii TaxID=109478 RepID=S7NJL3_MYOBR|nr:hypothetical protein D623_10020249 [Myotis brandtii]
METEVTVTVHLWFICGASLPVHLGPAETQRRGVSLASPAPRPASWANGRPGNQVVPPTGDSEQRLLCQWLQYHLVGDSLLRSQRTPLYSPPAATQADSRDPGLPPIKSGVSLRRGNPAASSDLSPTGALPPATRPEATEPLPGIV